MADQSLFTGDKDSLENLRVFFEKLEQVGFFFSGQVLIFCFLELSDVDVQHFLFEKQFRVAGGFFELGCIHQFLHTFHRDILLRLDGVIVLATFEIFLDELNEVVAGAPVYSFHFCHILCVIGPSGLSSLDHIQQLFGGFFLHMQVFDDVWDESVQVPGLFPRDLEPFQ